LRSLGAAVVLYCRDNDDRFPTPAVGWQVTDWVYWQSGHPLQGSRIAQYLGPALAKTLMCPADIEYHAAANPPYPYSYTINEFMARTTALGHAFPIRLAQIENPSEKILLIDESSGSIDDGCWAPQNYPRDGRNVLSNRHDRRTETDSNPNAGYGNVAYADGHAAFVARFDTTNPDCYVGFTNEPSW